MSDLFRILSLAGLPAPTRHFVAEDLKPLLPALMEASNARYLTMFNMFPDQIEKQAAVHEIDWAKRYLKRDDRIVWYLRWARIDIAVEYFKRIKLQYNDVVGIAALIHDQISTAKGILISLEEDQATKTNVHEERIREYASLVKTGQWRGQVMHFLSMGDAIPAMETYRFTNQIPSKIVLDLRKIEEAYSETDGRHVQATERNKGAEKILDFGDGYAWWNLNVSSCSAEAKAMGHCGNSAADRDGERVLSLRKREKRGNKIVDVPCLTFILDKDGFLGEMKGRGNKKPAAHYHKYIIPLLFSDLVEGIKGGGYLPANNFSLDDLTEEQKDEVLQKKPSLGQEMTLGRALNYFEEDGPGFLRQEDNRVIVWEDGLHAIEGGAQFSALLELIDDIDEYSDNINQSDIADAVYDLDEANAVQLAKHFNFAYKGWADRGNLARDVLRSRDAKAFVEAAWKDHESSISLDDIKAFITKQGLYDLVFLKYSASCMPELHVPSDPINGEYIISITDQEVMNLVEDARDNDGYDMYQFKQGWFDPEGADDHRWEEAKQSYTDPQTIKIARAIDDIAAKNASPKTSGKRPTTSVAPLLADAIIAALENQSRGKRPSSDEMDDLFGD